MGDMDKIKDRLLVPSKKVFKHRALISFKSARKRAYKAFMDNWFPWLILLTDIVFRILELWKN